MTLLVLSRGGIGRFVWKREGTAFAEAQWRVDSSYGDSESIVRALKKYVAPDSGWRVAYENSDIIVLERT